MGIPSVVAGECEERHYRCNYLRTSGRADSSGRQKDGTCSNFSRDKIFNGIIRSAQKRPVSSDEIEEIVNRIRAKGSQPK